MGVGNYRKSVKAKKDNKWVGSVGDQSLEK